MNPAPQSIDEQSSFGFTLIELVVVLFIVSILASLSLAGLAGARQRGKIDKTRSTIRKLHELIVPHYESYLRRRVPASGPEARLVRLRELVMFEMPDSWEDVGHGGDGSDGKDPKLLSTKDENGNYTDSAIIPPFAWNGVTQGYAAYHNAMLAMSPSFRTEFPSSECLYMVVSRGLGEPDLLDQFRSDEIGDVDRDLVPEFIDGWGQPIAFIRWPVGFDSPMQSQDALLQPDPFDPYRVSQEVNYPTTLQRDYAVTPLIISGGPDGATTQYGVAFGDIAWHTLFVPPLSGSPGVDPFPALTIRVWDDMNEIAGFRKDPDVAADNITNHDLFSR